MEEEDGSNRGVLWLKHSKHGLHCVHTRSLPVSTMAEYASAGVPMARSIRNSPLPAWTGTCSSPPDARTEALLLLTGTPVVRATSRDMRWRLRRAARCSSCSLE